ncbi:MAG: class I SAM-dependent methyltransferase [Firmicutes bacterium]|nr:class I SAM-dependent methyltransferase [Bacillota bacterium]
MSTNKENIEKFTDKAVGFAKYRPPYATAFFKYLLTKVNDAGNTVVADIGAGTGLFSKGLLDHGFKVVCIEPNAAMRLEASVYLSEQKGFKIIDGAAEFTNLPADRFDIVTAAQAFHLVNREAFLAEAERILKPYGKLALVWHMQDTDIALFKEIAEINHQFCAKFKGFAEGVDYKNPDEFNEMFMPGEVEYKLFDNSILLTREQFMGWIMAASFVPPVNSCEHKTYYNAISDLFIRHSVAGKITVPLKTVSYVGIIR